MIPNANARHFRIKAAQRDLIAACGGIERAAQICNYGKSTVGRWNNMDSPDLMPFEAVYALEAECGRDYFLEAYASTSGRKLAEDDDRAAKLDCLVGNFAQLVQASNDFISSTGIAFADNHCSPTEARQAIDHLVKLRERCEEGIQLFSGVQGEGGRQVFGATPKASS